MPDRNEEAQRSPDEQVRALYEDMESRTAKAFEQAVSTPSFGALLARGAENVAALTRIGSDAADLVAAQPTGRRSRRHHPAGPAAAPHRGQARTGTPGSRAAARRARAHGDRQAVVIGQRAIGGCPAAPFAGQAMSALSRLARTPATAFEFANTLLTTDDAVLGATERDVVWTHRETTLYRYRSTERAYPVPLLLVFALINRPAIFDLRPGHSLVEYLLSEGFDVFLLDWGYPDEEDAETGLDDYVLRRAALGHPGDPAGQRRRRADPAGLVHRGHAVRHVLRPGARGTTARAIRCATSPC